MSDVKMHLMGLLRFKLGIFAAQNWIKSPYHIYVFGIETLNWRFLFFSCYEWNCLKTANKNRIKPCNLLSIAADTVALLQEVDAYILTFWNVTLNVLPPPTRQTLDHPLKAFKSVFRQNSGKVNNINRMPSVSLLGSQKRQVPKNCKGYMHRDLESKIVTFP